MRTGDRLASEEARFRAIFRAVHADHPGCLDDEWLSVPCRYADGTPAPRPIVWSRRNGPWHQVDVLWVGAAPGNAGGKGHGPLGAHGTRIPFGGDIAGANFDVLLSTIGLDRNRTFVVAALNQLPEKGGGEPTFAELARPAGRFASSFHLLAATILAAGPRLIIALGTIGLRATLAAARLGAEPLRLPSPTRLQRAGLARGTAAPWPTAEPPADSFLRAWREAWGDTPLPHLLWLTHPSAQNMSPYARASTAFHRRMLEAQAALRQAAREVLRWQLPATRPHPPETGIYALPEWRELIRPRHEQLDRLWREKGV